MANTRDIILCCDCEGTQDELSRMWGAIEAADVAANFFFVGETVLAEPGLVAEIAARHQSESHTYHHPNLRKLPKKAQREAIVRGRETIEQHLQRPSRGFRAPYHALNRSTVEILNEEGFVFDASCLYYRYNMGGVQEISPTWFREWMPLYGTLHLPPDVTFGIFRALVRLNRLCVLPAHPQYSGLDASLAGAFERFLKWAVDHGAVFWSIDGWLEQRRGVAAPEWRAPTCPTQRGREVG
jgi:peptidoglycan/xylan/chitin deacetylase (PgdA/CDA1 family)